MDKCDTCRDLVPFTALSGIVERTVEHRQQYEELPPSALLRHAFRDDGQPSDATTPSRGLENAIYDFSQPLSNNPLISTASSYYYRRQPNCFTTAIYSGMRGAVVGSVFGGAMGLSTAVQSGFRGSAALTYAGQGAVRNAVAFSSWTALYGFTRCGCVRARGRDDIANAAFAGFLTGGVLTLASVRGQWRYNQSAILTNGAGSAMVAVMFHALNQM